MVEFSELLGNVKDEYIIYPYKDIESKGSIELIDEDNNKIEEPIQLPLSFKDVGFSVKHPTLELRNQILNSLNRKVQVKRHGKIYNETVMDISKSAKFFANTVVTDWHNIEINGQSKYQPSKLAELFDAYPQAYHLLSDYYLTELNKVQRDDESKKKDSSGSSESGLPDD